MHALLIRKSALRFRREPCGFLPTLFLKPFVISGHSQVNLLCELAQLLYIVTQIDAVGVFGFIAVERRSRSV